MTEVKFDVIRPNLYVCGDGSIFFGLDYNHKLFSVCKDVDRIIGKHIGELKVKRGDLEIMTLGEDKSRSKEFDTPLSEFFEAAEKYGKLGATNDFAELFGLGYKFDARNFDAHTDIANWRLSKEHLEDQELFDKFIDKRNNEILKIDKEKSLESIKELYQKLDREMPEYFVEFDAIAGLVPTVGDPLIKLLARVRIEQVKAEDRSKIEECQSELIERLKEVDGPCLSYDVPEIHGQFWKVYNNSKRLIDNYGDVLVNPGEWEKRLFKLDP